MSLLNSGVMEGLSGAFSYMKLAGVSMSVYRQAAARGDQAVMGRSLGYAGKSLGSAMKSGSQAARALEKAQAEAREQAEAEQEAALEERRQAATQESEAQRQAPAEAAPVDTVTIGDAGQTGAAENANAAARGTSAEVRAETSAQPAKTAPVQALAYTAHGTPNPAPAKATVSVTA